MKAAPVIRRRVAYGVRDLAELVVWRVPTPVPPSRHRLKYSLVYVVDGRRVIGFDNERGKGDHVHLDDHELPYEWQGLDRLLDDFVAAVERWRNDHGRG